MIIFRAFPLASWMLRRILRPAFWVGLAGYALAGCVYPTEKGGQLTVRLDTIPPLIEGEVVALGAVVVDQSGSPIPNTPIEFESSDPLVAVVGGENRLLATGTGDVEIMARAIGVGGAAVGVQTVRVHGVLEIDSIAPANVRYGDTVLVYGSGLSPDSLFAVRLSGVDAVVGQYTPLNPDERHRFGVLRLWARMPAPPQSVVEVFGFNGFTVSPDSVRVLRFDVYEPNDIAPWDFGQLPGSVVNPALAFERRPRDDSIGVDWYRFEQPTRGDRSIILRSADVGPEGFDVIVTNDISFDSSEVEFVFGANAWAVSGALTLCGGIPFAPPQFRDDSVVIAFKDLAPGQYDVFTVYQRFAAYEMGIVSQHRSQFPPDQAEENDYCDVAAPIPATAVRQFNIDNPHDIDWFRASYNDTTVVTLDVTATAAEADIDLYVLRDFGSDSLQVMGLGQVEGVSDALGLTLVPGNYYFVVVDFQGVPTTYTFRTASTKAQAGSEVSPPIITLRPHGRDGRGTSLSQARTATLERRP